MSVLIINHEEVKTLLPMKTAINVMEEAFSLYNEGGLIPPRSGMFLEGGRVLGAMPAYLNAIGKLGIKANTVFAGNSGTQYHIHQGVVLVFEDNHGCLEAIVDAAEITNIRTAAASGLATKLLANENASKLAIIGAGTQGSHHLEAMLAVRKIGDIRVCDISPVRSNEFSKRESAIHGVEISVFSDIEETVKGTDIVCISTPSVTPVLLGSMISEGTHINSVGFSGPKGRELDNELLKKSRIYVDCRESIIRDCGDIILPISENIIKETDIIADLTQLLINKALGRTCGSDITLYKSAGVSIQDLACAHYIFKQAQERGMGITVEISGKNSIA